MTIYSAVLDMLQANRWRIFVTFYWEWEKMKKEKIELDHCCLGTSSHM
jgi:hypothetical protein